MTDDRNTKTEQNRWLTSEKWVGVLLLLLFITVAVTAVVVANDVGPLGPSVAVDDATNGTNITTVEPGNTTYIDVGLNTTQTSDKKFTSPAVNTTLPSGWDIDPIYSSGSATFKDKGNIGEWLWLNNRSRSNITYEVNVPAGASSGNYTINTLGAAINSTTDNRVTDTTSTIITVSERPTADFTASPDPANTSETITFDASSSNDPDGAIQSYNWSFGDGTTANETGSTTTNSYSDNGTYSVTLTVTGDAGLTNSTTKTVTVNNRPPNVAINANRTTVRVGEDIQFDNGTTSDPDGNVTGNGWDFGDGNTATGTPVTHSYSSAGTYQVNLTATDDDGATNTTSITIDVQQEPNVDINANQTTVLTGEDIQFDNATSSDPDGSIVSNDWEFGDGAIGSGTPVTHSYSDNGTYQVNLTVTDDDGLTNTTNITVTVNNRQPVPNFTASPDPANTSETITFDASSTTDSDGTIQSYNWSFGDGTTANETGTTTTNSYSDNGTYSVTLTVTDDDGATNTTTKTVTVNNRPPNVAINANQTTVEVGEDIQFDNATSSDPDGNITSNDWEFGDGAIGSGTPVTHSYSSAGTYQVNLTVTDDDGATNTTSITVDVQAPPNVAINANQTTVLTGEDIQFDNATSSDPDGNITSNDWEFGDGAIGSGTPVTHSYSDNGTYQVNLTVTDDDGLTNTTNITVTVNNRPPNVAINANQTTVNVGEDIQFDNATSSDPDGSIVGNGWEFGDGNTATGTPVVYSYSSPGDYQVNLTVADDDNATNTTSINVTVQQGPTADFNFSQGSAEPTVNETINFNASASSDPDGTIQSYNWSFGDGTNGTSQTTTNTYGSDITYNVNLTVTDNDGLTDSTVKSVGVKQCRPVAIADYDTTDQQINLYEIQFGVSWYQTDSVVPNSGEVFGPTTPPYPSTNALTEIQNRINDWQSSSTVSC